MAELRKDPIIGRWVIIATERSSRPHDFVTEEDESAAEPCPFCEGNESATPPEIFAFRSPGTKPDETGWKVRVIPSGHPALISGGDLNRQGVGMYDMMDAVGSHEVIIETPQAIHNIADLSAEQISLVMRAYIERINCLERDPRFKYVLIFKNHGRAAGASSIRHSHSQLVATPVNPRVIKRKLDGAKRYFEYKERCIFCDIIKEEMEGGKRVIVDTDGFIAVAPFASRFPFETVIFPKKHSADFGKLTQADQGNFAQIIKIVMSRLTKTLSNPPYNYIIHTAPFKRTTRAGYWRTLDKDYHWHMEIIPRLTGVAGFEWGSGFYINPVVPEIAAEELRAVEV